MRIKSSMYILWFAYVIHGLGRSISPRSEECYFSSLFFLRKYTLREAPTVVLY
jgi:hypothetical protein